MYPISVNEKMEVIAGQHRLAAAEELGLEVFYIVDKISYEHVLDSNLAQKRMSLEDVIRFYSIKDKIPDYVCFQEYINLLGLSSKALIGLLFGSVSKSIIDFIKSGKFKLPSDQHTIGKITSTFCKFKNFVREKRLTPFSMFSSCNFTVAFRNLVLLQDFKEDIFFGKLEMRWFDLKPQLNAKEWTRTLISIYNWKNHSPLPYGE